MSDNDIDKPQYLLIAEWILAQNRQVSAKEIAGQFDIPHCKAINTVSYILSEVDEIECETQTIPNQLAGRGCQCQRLVQVKHIDKQLYSRLKASSKDKENLRGHTSRLATVPPVELDPQQKWQWMLSKTQRR
ncbi:carnitine metabolism transcriptional regulator CaiF [Entomohabitans teleogrylli]|uniref:carnitine metabolism transcriptional regulator CaiF n=1 Tax=Entomohabitans teleogrylli TaxID=1384589 RepID=UPI00073D5793|nr:carnitine metabolism transcriptional regulator CaiF [Entomohabitans teleogrylli]